MSLRIYDTLRREKRVFEPADPSHVRMYVCGPTVYDYAHIGNARPVVVFDVLYRLLKRLYPRVTYARNITDVDDKIIAAAKESGEPIAAITQRFADRYHADMAALGALPPDIEPRATQHIPQMIAMIEKLVASGHAYAADPGSGSGAGAHVLFNVPSMAAYGRLSRHSRDELIAGARVEVAPYKRDPADFVLWKPSTDDQPGWDSPWGRGRPGWHLECSAMSETHLGQTFDIHGGGQDLIFPHHENEIAQSVCAHDGAEFVRYWMHNGYLTVDGEKMSKSLGNFYTVRDVLERFRNERVGGEVVRLTLLRTYYRSPLDWTDAALNEAQSNLNRWYRVQEEANKARENYKYGDLDKRFDYDVPPDVRGALEDDLNTPEAISRFNYIADEAFSAARREDTENLLDLAGQLRASGALIGLLKLEPDEWFGRVVTGVGHAAGSSSASAAGQAIWSADLIEEKISLRAKARSERDFEQADRIRQELAEQGVILEDKPDGTTDWRRA